MSEAMNMQFIVITSVVFAYLIAGHLAGAGLPKSVCVAVTVLYCGFMVGPFAAYYLDYARLFALSEQYHQQYPDGFMITELPSWGVWPPLAPMLLAWFGSIYYVHYHVRSNGRRGT